jgi:plastocyanin
VLWVWEGGGHNVKPESTPSSSEWTGTPGGRVETFASGYRYGYTFDTPGECEYICVPHQSAEMRASSTVE